MQRLIGEYGRILITAALIGGLAVFLFGTGGQNFLGMITKNKPIETVGEKDTFESIAEIASRPPPKLNVKTKKLRKGYTYNLLSQDEFLVSAENADSQPVEVGINSIRNPLAEEVSGSIDPTAFRPGQQGTWAVTYQAAEVYRGQEKKTEKTYRFIVD